MDVYVSIDVSIVVILYGSSYIKIRGENYFVTHLKIIATISLKLSVKELSTKMPAIATFIPFVLFVFTHNRLYDLHYGADSGDFTIYTEHREGIFRTAK